MSILLDANEIKGRSSSTSELLNSNLLKNVRELVESARREASKNINLITLQTNGEIGRLIFEEEQRGKERAAYGDRLIINLSKELTKTFGRGFSVSNLKNMRLFYIKYQKSQTLSGQFENTQKKDKNGLKTIENSLKFNEKGQTLSGQFRKSQSPTGQFEKVQTVSGLLSWSHYTLLLQISDDNERRFYEKECENSRWSVRQLKRQIDSSMYQRILFAKSDADKDEIMRLSNEGITYSSPEDVLKEPVVLDLFGANEAKPKYESDLEDAIVNHIEKFLIELGRGYMFVGSQYRISIACKNYYVDLVFYNKILKCYVLIDLKINSLEAENIGQMNLYVNYFKNEINDDGDNDPIGIILCAEKDKVVAKYAMDGLKNNIYASKYTYIIPDKERLEEELERYLLENNSK